MNVFLTLAHIGGEEDYCIYLVCVNVLIVSGNYEHRFFKRATTNGHSCSPCQKMFITYMYVSLELMFSR